MKRLIASCLLLSLLLCGCTGAVQLKPDLTNPTTEATQPTTEATQPTTEATEPTTEATEPTTEPTEPEPAYRHPLNGSPMDEPLLNRPYAVVFDCKNRKEVKQCPNRTA